MQPLRRALFPAPPIVVYTALNALNAGNKSLTWHELCGDKFPGRIFDSLVELKLPSVRLCLSRACAKSVELNLRSNKQALKDHAYFTDLISLWPDVNTATHWDDIAVPAGPRAAAVAGAAATTAAAKETVGSKRRRGGSPVKRRAGGPLVPVKATVVKSAEYVDDKDDGEEHDELDEGFEPPPAKKQKAKVRSDCLCLACPDKLLTLLCTGPGRHTRRGRRRRDRVRRRDGRDGRVARRQQEGQGGHRCCAGEQGASLCLSCSLRVSAWTKLTSTCLVQLPAAPSTTSSSPLKVNVPASSARTATACITLDDDDDDEVERAAALWPRPDGIDGGETDIGLTATRLFSYILGGQVLSSETLDAIAKDVQAPDAGLDMVRARSPRSAGQAAMPDPSRSTVERHARGRGCRTRARNPLDP